MRFPDAELIESQTTLTTTLGKVVRAIVPLDMRGTPYEIKVWSMLRALSVRETTSDGALAAKMGTRDARR